MNHDNLKHIYYGITDHDSSEYYRTLPCGQYRYGTPIALILRTYNLPNLIWQWIEN